MSRPPLRLFEGYGIEVEYMIVHRETLKVLPVTDWLLKKVSGGYNNEVEMGDLDWSNELVMHAFTFFGAAYIILMVTGIFFRWAGMELVFPF